MGAMGGTYPFERSVSIIGWRKSIMAIGIITTIFAFGFFILYTRIKKEETKTAKVSFENVTSVITNIFTFPIYISNCISFSIYFLIQSAIGKKVLEDCFQFNPKKAASYILVLIVACMITSAISGLVSKFINHKRKPLIIIGSSMSLCFCILMIFAIKGILGQYILLPAFILLGSSAIGIPVGSACIKELNSSHISATAISFINGATYAAIAILTTACGYIMDLFKTMIVKKDEILIYPKEAYMAIFTMCIVLAIFSLFGSLLVKETQGVCLEN
jgi:predicted MFS family arabinose efflux permease